MLAVLQVWATQHVEVNFVVQFLKIYKNIFSPLGFEASLEASSWNSRNDIPAEWKIEKLSESCFP